MTKREGRKRAESLLRGMEAERRRGASLAAARRLAQSAAWKDAELVLTYVSLPRELDTTPVIEAARAQRKLIAIPRISGPDLVFHLLRGDAGSLVRGALGIPEPDPSWPIVQAPLRGCGRSILIVVPGLAFDRNLWRLGRGKGYYDRLLRLRGSPGERGNASAIALCFQAQLWDEVPHGGADEPVDGIITEAEALGTAAEP